MIIDQDIIEVLTLLEQSGYKAYLVGGYLRDLYLNIKSEDYDIATSATYEQIESLFKPENIIDNKGKTFLNIKVKIKEKIYEITSLRIEGPYKKLGYPSSISTTNDIYQDLARRDFTINALAYSLKEGLIDAYSGLKDIKEKLIRSIKDPNLSYKEDPTRILRAIRFATKLNFSIDQNDQIAIKKYAYLINKLSKNQLSKEINKILEVYNDKCFSLFQEFDILNAKNFISSKDYLQYLSKIKRS